MRKGTLWWSCYVYWDSILLKTLKWEKSVKNPVVCYNRRRRKFKLSGELSVHAKRRLKETKVGGLWWKSLLYSVGVVYFVRSYMWSTFLCYPRCLKWNGVEFCFSCRISSLDLEKSIGFNSYREGVGHVFSGGYHSKRLNHYLNYDASLYKRDLLSYLRLVVGEELSDKKVLKGLIEGVYRIPKEISKRYKHSPWLKKGVQGKKGTYYRLEKYYKSSSRCEWGLIRLVCENKRLLVLTLKLIRDSLVVSEKRKEDLTCRVLSNVSLSEWSVYSYLIKDSVKRKSLVVSSCMEKVCGVYKPRYRIKSGDVSNYYKRGSLSLKKEKKYWL